MPIINATTIGGLNCKNATATADKILAPYTAGVGKELITGSMPNNGNASTSIANGILKSGYTSGGVIVNLIEENIKNGVNIGGKVGTLIAATQDFIIPADISSIGGYQPAIIGNENIILSSQSDASGIYVLNINTLELKRITTVTYPSCVLSSFNSNSMMISNNHSSDSDNYTFYNTTDCGETWNQCTSPVSASSGKLLTNGESFVFIKGYNSTGTTTSSTAYITTNLGTSWYNASLKNTGASRDYYSGDITTGYYYCLHTDKSTVGDYYEYHTVIYRSKDFNTWSIWQPDVYLGKKSTSLSSTQYLEAQALKVVANTFCITKLDYYRSSSGAGASSWGIIWSRDNGATWIDMPTGAGTASLPDPESLVRIWSIGNDIYVYVDYNYKSTISASTYKLSSSSSGASHVSINKVGGNYPITFCTIGDYLVYYYSSIGIRLVKAT